MKAAQESKSINEKKPVVLNELLGKRLELKEALQTGIDKTDEYKDSMKRYEEAVLFNRFIQKIIVPDLKVGEEDQRARREPQKGVYETAHGETEKPGVQGQKAR